MTLGEMLAEQADRVGAVDGTRCVNENYVYWIESCKKAASRGQYEAFIEILTDTPRATAAAAYSRFAQDGIILESTTTIGNRVFARVSWYPNVKTPPHPGGLLV